MTRIIALILLVSLVSPGMAQSPPFQPVATISQIMSAITLLTEIPRPSDTDIDAAMSGNVCRCATYVRIRAAIHEASRTLGG